MGLAPSPHPLGTPAIAEVRKVLGFTIPSLLTGELTGLATLGFAAVMLMLPVPVIRKKTCCNSGTYVAWALGSSRPETNTTAARIKTRQRHPRRTKTKKQEELSGEEPEEKTGEEERNIEPVVFEEYHRAGQIRRLRKQAAELGYQIVDLKEAA
jgi:hypothetical protein